MIKISISWESYPIIINSPQTCCTTITYIVSAAMATLTQIIAVMYPWIKIGK